ncbi:MAG: N-sulfoglucosamine sulfohydrolase, partial [Saprospiraceae bacterium]
MRKKNLLIENVTIRLLKENYIFLLLIVSFIALMSGCTKRTILNEPPNILWITSEDMNAFIGAFGDSLANTPHLDQLAKDGVRYTHTFATAPVCSPSRSCLITGIYATSFGTQHLRSVIDMPSEVVPYPKYLRQAGYYCTNQGKDDYNFVDSTIWDENSNTAHWRNRKEGQPFFSVFNIMTTHQSQIFGTDEVFEKKYGQQLDDNQRKDPVEINVPPYHFDTPVVRKLWARYYDLVTLMDREVGAILSQLEQDGLLENTIVFYYSDHGTGMPRSKRALYDSGLRVPLIIKAPKRWRKQLNLITGSIKEDMVSFVDFAPTLLNLCQIEIPDQMQGVAFLGDGSTKQ